MHACVCVSHRKRRPGEQQVSRGLKLGLAPAVGLCASCRTIRHMVVSVATRYPGDVTFVETLNQERESKMKGRERDGGRAAQREETWELLWQEKTQRLRKKINSTGCIWEVG